MVHENGESNSGDNLGDELFADGNDEGSGDCGNVKERERKHVSNKDFLIIWAQVWKDSGSREDVAKQTGMSLSTVNSRYKLLTGSNKEKGEFGLKIPSLPLKKGGVTRLRSKEMSEADKEELANFVAETFQIKTHSS